MSFHMELLCDGATKVFQTALFTSPIWPPCPYTVKTLKIVISGTKRLMTLKLGMQHWVLEYYQVCSNDDPGLTLTCFTARSNLATYAFVWKKGKTKNFSETSVVYVMKVGRCNLLNGDMNLYEYQRSRPLTDLGPRSLRFNIFKHLFLRNN